MTELPAIGPAHLPAQIDRATPGAAAGQSPRPHDPAQMDRAHLRRMCHELEGVFLMQLFQAMRQSVPERGIYELSYGEELFTSLLDEGLASEAARRMNRGIGEALYRQLSRRLPPEDLTEPTR